MKPPTDINILMVITYRPRIFKKLEPLSYELLHLHIFFVIFTGFCRWVLTNPQEVGCGYLSPVSYLDRYPTFATTLISFHFDSKFTFLSFSTHIALC